MPRGFKDGGVIKKLEKRAGKEQAVEVWYARVRWADADGRKRELKRKALSQADANRLLRELHAEKDREIESEAAKLTHPKHGHSFEARLRHYEEVFRGLIEALVREHALIQKRSGGAKRASGRRTEWPLQRCLSFLSLYESHLIDVERARRGLQGDGIPAKIVEMIARKIPASDIALHWAAGEFGVDFTEYLRKVLSRGRQGRKKGQNVDLGQN
jgi:hypothetical protein